MNFNKIGPRKVFSSFCDIGKRCRCTTFPSYQIAPGYKPSEVEKGALLAGILQGEFDSETKPPFVMILPPPNVTGNLHLGHALMCTIQDVICRRKRQDGHRVIWVPGTDHAGIATQVVVEKKLLKERNISRQELGRDGFVKEVWKWKKEKGASIVGDMKRMGATVNWGLEYFTMDKAQSEAVTEAFVRLFDMGYINRQNSLVNWSCSLESSISDIEVETLDLAGPTDIAVPGYDKNITFGKIYDIAYKTKDGSAEIIVSTTRPETLLGDVAIAVNPEDERYTRYRQDQVKFWHPIRKEPLPLLFDSSVDKEFGTGAVKITPAHDKFDFQLAKVFGLDPIEVVTERGKIDNRFEGYSRMPRFLAREKILNDLAEMGLLRSVRPHPMQLPICQRSKDIVEYLLRPQWFILTKKLAKLAIEAVESGRIKITPSNFENEWHRWLKDSRDWCISRQLWWGHGIPAYEIHSNGCSMWIAARTGAEALAKAEKKFKKSGDYIRIRRDPDVLDTWFSSSLLPFTVFGWPLEAFKNFYPIDLMETGHDILFFWVARMVMLGIALAGDVPFRNVLLHGIVCDANGRKMSKSLGNVVLPEQVIQGSTIEDLEKEIQRTFENGIINEAELEKSLAGLKKLFPNGIPECGTDALRFTLCSHNIKNHFINFDVNECYTNKLFFNKIWQATRYTMGCCERLDLDPKTLSLNSIELNSMDRWILSKLGNTRKAVEQSFENYNFHQGVLALKTFFYNNFCDVYLETTKSEMSHPNRAASSCAVLSACISLGLQTMSPFTPFLCRELLQYFPRFKNIVDSRFIDMDQEKEVDSILEICTAIRQLKSQYNISKKHDPMVHIFPETSELTKLLEKYKENIRTLSQAHEVRVESEFDESRRVEFEVFSTASHICSFGISTNDKYVKHKLDSSVNTKKLKRLEDALEKLMKRVSTDGYKKAATQTVQESHSERIKELETEIRNIKGMRS